MVGIWNGIVRMCVWCMENDGTRSAQCSVSCQAKTNQPNEFVNVRIVISNLCYVNTFQKVRHALITYFKKQTRDLCSKFIFQKNINFENYVLILNFKLQIKFKNCNCDV